jgi:hypothetical protein
VKWTKYLKNQKVKVNYRFLPKFLMNFTQSKFIPIILSRPNRFKYKFIFNLTKMLLSRFYQIHIKFQISNGNINNFPWIN